jgi:hypothetical protein
MLTETLLNITSFVIGRCSLVPISHLKQGKCARINWSQAASGITLQNLRRLLVYIFSFRKDAFFYNLDKRVYVVIMQTELYMKPEAPPPPPPPPPPKTLFGGLFKSQVLRRTKRAKSVPENIHSAVQGEVTNTTFVLFDVQLQTFGLNPDFLFFTF